MRLLLLNILFFLHLIILGSPPPALITGKVYDLETGQPLPGATILYGRNKGTTTDLEGFYQLEAAPGVYTINFQYIGYRTHSQTIQIKSEQTIVLDAGLPPEIAQMDQVVISAGKVTQRIAESTVSASIVRPETMSSSHISDPRELMNRTPGIEVLDGQASIRGGSGFSYGAGSRVLPLIDGLPALAADAGSIRWNFIPLENLSHIEVIKGASSVLYGSSALNGIINFRMAEPNEQGATSFFLESGIFDKPANRNWIWWDTPRMFSSASFSHIKRYNNTGVSIGSFLMTDNGYRRLNDQHLGRINLRLTHQNPRFRNLNFGITVHGGYNKKRDFLLWEDVWQGALKQSPATESLLHGSFFAFDPFVSLSRGDYSRHDLRLRLQGTDNDFPGQSQNNSTARSLYAEYQFAHALSSSLSINSGLVQYFSVVRSNFYGDHNARNSAAYSQAELSPSHRLKLVAGLRIEQNILNSQSDRMVPLFRTGINFQAANLTFLRASFGQGYRYPSIAEKYAATSLGVVAIYPNPDILPESGWGIETGIKQGILTPDFDVVIDLALFYNQNKDLLEYVFGIYPDPSTGEFDFGFRATNIEHSRVYGMELEFRVHNTTGWFENTVSGGYVFMYPVEFDPRTNRDTGIYLKFRRKHAFNLNLGTAFQRMDMNLNLSVRSRILNIDDVFLNELTREQVLPGFYHYWQENNTGYWVADYNIGYRISQIFRISLSVKNMLNAEYMGRPGDIQPQRSFSLRLSGAW